MKSRIVYRDLILFLALAFSLRISGAKLFASPAASQAENATMVAGSVTDEDIKPLAGVEILAEYLGTIRDIGWRARLEDRKFNLNTEPILLTRRTTSSEAGRWSISGIPGGIWKITATMKPDKSFTRFLQINPIPPQQSIILKEGRYTFVGRFTTMKLIFFNKYSLEKNNLVPWSEAEMWAKAMEYCQSLRGVKKRQCLFFLGKVRYAERLRKWVVKGITKQAEAYCLLETGYYKNLCYQELGEALAERGEYAEALRFYRMSKIHTQKRAKAAIFLADSFWSQGDKIAAKTAYLQAFNEYNNLIKRWDYEWEGKDQEMRLHCLVQLAKFKKTAAEIEESKKLRLLLKRASQYCDKLNNSLLDFLCTEKITEINCPRQSSGIGRRVIKESKKGVIKVKAWSLSRNRITYYYRLDMKGDKVRENRFLSRRDGKKKKLANAQLLTRLYFFEKIIFGPMELLSQYWQKYYFYDILKDESKEAEGIVAIEVLPRRLYKKNFLFGKIWIKENPFQILKIQWHPKSIENFREVMENTTRNNSEPYITYFTEFNVAHKGIRFPSRNYLELGFSTHKEKRVTFLANVRYLDYLYYKVDTKVRKTLLGE